MDVCSGILSCFYIWPLFDLVYLLFFLVFFPLLFLLLIEHAFVQFTKFIVVLVCGYHLILFLLIYYEMNATVPKCGEEIMKEECNLKASQLSPWAKPSPSTKWSKIWTAPPVSLLL
ncbi:hypothetical protein ACJIZ3_010066 [Penstemon smallii]|uniref:Uncharacterized protein n=1 Tax=Penstemon smallii TaxID=265156 RepID=A0ABD3TFU1_9LAMI